MQRVDLLIVGGGISGLSCAAWMQPAELAMELWESSHRVGGKIGSHRQQGYLCEQSASMVVNHLAPVEQLIHACGAAQQRMERPASRARVRYLLEQERLHPLPPSLPGMARSSLISWRGKLRMLAEPLIPRSTLTEESAAAFIRRRLGSELLERALDPYISGTLACDPEQACARSVLPRLNALEQEYRSILLGALWQRLRGQRTPMGSTPFSFAEGMQHLPRQLARLVQQQPGQLQLQHRVESIEPCRLGWRVHATTGRGERTLECRQLVLCCPAPEAARLLAASDPELGQLLATIEYAPITLVHTGFRTDQVQHPLDSQGFLTPSRSPLTINGSLWPSSVFDNRAPAGHHLLTTYLGGSRRPEARDWNDADALQRVLEDLDRVLGLRGEPGFVELVRHPQALPLYQIGHYQRGQRIEQLCRRLPGLHLNGNYLGGVSIRDRIAASHRLARRLGLALGEPLQARSTAVSLGAA
ncbi:protoporphyrinogen oxidase [Aestuariirhabdus litorea]|uniref:Protoporphyrinogen oxidase n=1 Tax=Aestuariirhabdus litorea TaxID=2528527 RepID=A0A3P3VQH4_9GAMM|nr:protoporphyrinogen oxidase [Aestuariirhabdus litorea]RRJ85041.1 protoporphyrinogen oxidase [Aestuariirhabdus litorea]RWW98266.1 protoporphyrinogen oxidase [Endozoicomonadaceae bacterium GTF-13]